MRKTIRNFQLLSYANMRLQRLKIFKNCCPILAVIKPNGHFIGTLFPRWANFNGAFKVCLLVRCIWQTVNFFGVK